MQNFTLTFHVFTYNINSTCKNFHLGFSIIFCRIFYIRKEKIDEKCFSQFSEHLKII